MSFLKRTLPLYAALAALFLTASCVVSPPRGAVFVRVAPPVAVVEAEGAAPGPEFVWIRGYHRWDGERYVWVAGHWDRRPHARAVWVNGEWKHHRNGWYWVDGHWR
jgi:hypothetical protein